MKAQSHSLEEIPPSPDAKPYALKASYAAGQAELSYIYDYNAVDAERKKQFHQDALRYLRCIGAHLRESGITHLSCESNPGGIAVGGEVYARYLHQDEQRVLFLTLKPIQWGIHRLIAKTAWQSVSSWSCFKARSPRARERKSHPASFAGQLGATKPKN